MKRVAGLALLLAGCHDPGAAPITVDQPEPAVCHVPADLPSPECGFLDVSVEGANDTWICGETQLIAAGDISIAGNTVTFADGTVQTLTGMCP